ncbi:Ig-like domain-containing protein, partial [Pseudomonas koreensis]|uniref:Ig-like domain-containing protein n=1 Tax=Pseudomonas koreensis TaxID=198620 RepID=UPI002E28FBBE
NYLKTVKGDIVTRVWEGSITGVNSDRVELSSITAGQPVAFPIKAELIKGNEGGTVKAYYDIKRAAGGTSYSDTLAFSVGVALDLKEPKIKQAPNDTSLDPLEAQNALTSVINYDGMLVGDKIIVRWTGAPGTPAAGSHTTEPWPVTTVGPQEIPLAVSVIAFNLAKSITLDYTVTRGTQDPKESRIRALAVSPIAQSDLPGPLITQASEQGEGPELDVSQLTTNATLRANSYPHIALRQYVWLKAKGTLKGGGDYSKTFWQPPGSQTNATWINQGFYTHTFPLPDLQSLEDGRDLELEFKAGFGGTQVESEAVTFALRTYRIKAYENVVPTLGSVTGSPSGDEIPHGGLTVETAVTLSGVAAKGQKVEIFDGTVSKDQATAHATTGVWTLLVSALAVAAHSFTVKALYGSGAVSAARTLTVIADTAPTLTSVKGSPSGDEIPHGGLTVETAVTLSGVAAKGQKVEIYDGTVSKDQATAHATTGVWTLLVSALAVAAHSFTVKALYGSGAVSAARTLTVTPVVVPTLSNVLDDKNVEIPEGQTTVSTALKLIGTASKGQRVEIFEGNGPSHTSKGVATASTATGMWELPITVAVGARRLYAGSLYTSSPQWSNVRTLTVTEATAPTLDNVLDDKGVVVPKNTNTLSTSLTLKGSASIGQKVEIFDGTTSIGEVTATLGIWEKLITGLSLTSHTFTAKAVYGSGAVSTAWKVTVQAFTLDRSPMNLNGLCLILDPSNSPRWKKSGAVEPGTTQTRRPTVAAEPVSYVSSNPSITSVDSSGKVTSVNKGKSIITVTDARLNSGTYEVNVTNVHRITIRRGTVTSAQGNAWIASVGGINGGEYVMNTLQRLCSNDGELGTQYTGSTTRFYAVESHSSQAYLMGIDSGGDVSRNSVVAMIPV